ncbi:MAG: hypothetical protein HY376_03025 [Candidatus Blackburnbacteria bacterium]|nr:hypothetical protein [Candidatus Blackburnbacteria bacterium]
MKGKILILTAVFAMAFLIGAIQASATSQTNTINLTAPSTNTIITGTINLTAQVNGSNYNQSGGGNPDTANITRVTFQISTDAGSTWTTFASNDSNVNNGTMSNWTINVATLNLSDTTAYLFRALAGNGTIGNNTRATSGTVSVRVDNTVPVFSQFLQTANTILTSDPSTISVTTINTSICTLRFGSNPTSYNMTQSGNTCSYSLKRNVVPDSTYDVRVTIGDGLNGSFNTQPYTISLLSQDAIAPGGVGGASVTGVGQAAVQVQQQKQEFSLTTIAVVIIAAIVVINGKKLGLFK